MTNKSRAILRLVQTINRLGREQRQLPQELRKVERELAERDTKLTREVLRLNSILDNISKEENLHRNQYMWIEKQIERTMKELEEEE